MKTLAFLAALILPGFVALAEAENAPAEAAQAFYDAYMKVLLNKGDTQNFILTSDDVTASFKKAFTKLVKDGMDSDPIICGQDYPDAGFTASPARIRNDKASVTMKSRDDTFQHSFKVTLRLVDDRWLISDTNDLKADAAD